MPLNQSNLSVVQWPDWIAEFTNLRAIERFPVRFDRAQMSLDKAMQGLGVALESSASVGMQHAARKLRPVYGLEQGIAVKAHFAAYPARHAKRAAVEAFLAWLHGKAAKTGRARTG